MNAAKYHNTRPIPELTERDKRRFWSKVHKLGPDDCWEWQAFRKPKGYGVFGICRKFGRQFYAHRVSFSLNSGIRDIREDIRHTCDNPPCCNPAHLLPGTIQDNNRDMLERGRKYCRPKIIREPKIRPDFRGEGSPVSVLTEVEVIEILRDFKAGKSSQSKLAIRFNVSRSTINLIVKRKRWGHVDA